MDPFEIKPYLSYFSQGVQERTTGIHEIEGGHNGWSVAIDAVDYSNHHGSALELVEFKWGGRTSK